MVGDNRRGRTELGDISSITTIRDCFNAFNVNVFDKPTENFFDIKSNKKLDYVLRHGYSFKHHEKKHFTAKKSVDAFKRANKDFLNITVQNKSLMGSIQPRASSNDASLSISMSSQNLYAELFNDRYRKLTQSIMVNAQETGENSVRNEDSKEMPLMQEGKACEEINNAKKNRMYKDLGMNLNLKEIFNELNFDELRKLKKLHVLYASSKTKNKEASQKAAPEIVPEEKK